MLPPAIEAFTRLPFWNTIFLLMAAAIAVYSGTSLRRTGARQDLYYLLTGLYLVAVQLPGVFPDAFRLLGITMPAVSSPPGLVLAAPAAALFILGVRAGGAGQPAEEAPVGAAPRHGGGQTAASPDGKPRPAPARAKPGHGGRRQRRT